MMMICPYCSAENIEGMDACEECGQPLNDLYEPATDVEARLLSDRVSSLRPKTPITVLADTPVGDVLKQMVDCKVGCVMVFEHEGSSSFGVFSERDALMKLNIAAAENAHRPVREFMTSSPQTLEANAKIAFAVQRMDLGGYRHVPIVDHGGKLQGVISVRDILRYLSDQMTA